MVESNNFVINNGDSLVFYLENNNRTIVNTFATNGDYLFQLRIFLTNYHSDISTLNGANGNIYYIVNQNIKSIEYNTDSESIKIVFNDDTYLQISFHSAIQAKHNYLYLTSSSFDVANYIKDKNKLYVHPNNSEDIPNGVFSDIQTAINNKTESDIIYLQTGTLDLTADLEITNSTFIYCESDVIINGNIIATLTESNQTIRLYGEPNLNGYFTKYDYMEIGDATDLYIHLSEWVGSPGNYCRASFESNFRVKAKSIDMTGNGFDTDSYLDSFDIDCLSLISEGKISYMSNSGYTYLYFRNFNAISDYNSEIYLGETGGTYELNIIGSSFNRGLITFSDDVSNIVNLWNSDFKTSTAYFINSSHSFTTYLNLYGKNFSNKTFPSYVEKSGAGTLTVNENLDLD